MQLQSLPLLQLLETILVLLLLPFFGKTISDHFTIACL